MEMTSHVGCERHGCIKILQMLIQEKCKEMPKKLQNNLGAIHDYFNRIDGDYHLGQLSVGAKMAAEKTRIFYVDRIKGHLKQIEKYLKDGIIEDY